MIEIRLLVIPNAFKRQAEESDHHRACVEGNFRRNLVFYGLGSGVTGGTCLSELPLFNSPTHKIWAATTYPAAT